MDDGRSLSSCLLLSGGMDSIAMAYWKRPRFAVTIDYGQVCAEAEVRAAGKIAHELGIGHEVVVVDSGRFGSGDMSKQPPNSVAPVTEWWPFRNQLLISIASIVALHCGVERILIGTVKSDSMHIDGTMDFFLKVNELLSMQEGNVEVEAPAISMTTEELIARSAIDRPLLAWAHSCHVSNYACGQCRGCFKHQRVTSSIGGYAY